MPSPQFERRSLRLDLNRANDQKLTIPASVSSEEPVERFWGLEVLEHTPEAVDLSRALGGSLPLLVSHNPDEVPRPGNATHVRLNGRRLRCVLEFSDTPRGRELYEAARAGFLDGVSIGYRIEEAVDEGRTESGLNKFRVTRWQPYEVSLVNVPADATVGVGRSLPRPAPRKEAPKMDPRIEVNDDPALAERTRCSLIAEIARNNGMTEAGNKYISEGKSVDEFRALVLEKIAGGMPKPRTVEIGLNRREVEGYSLRRLVDALANPQDRRKQEAAAFEYEVSAAAVQARGSGLRQNAIVSIPAEVFGRRDLVVGTGSLGGNLVQTDLLADQFIEALRNESMVLAAGATVLNGLVGNVAIPKRTGTSVGYWVAEGNAPTESTAVTFGQVTLTPKTVGAFVDYTRKMLLQSTPAIEGIMRQDLFATLGLAVDAAAINGAGTGAEPLGIIASTAIGTSSMGAQAAALTWAGVVAPETAIATGNGLRNRLAYMTSPAVMGSMKTTVKGTAGSLGYLWNENNPAAPVNGYPCFVTNQVPTNLTYGTTTGSAKSLIFGDWSQLFIGMWSGVDLLVDPYTASSSGTVRLVALQDVDIAFRQTAAFNKVLGIS